MAWISHHKHKIEEKSTKSSRSSSKVVGLGLANLWEFLTLGGGGGGAAAAADDDDVSNNDVNDTGNNAMLCFVVS